MNLNVAENLQDEPRPRWPMDVTTPEMMKIHEIAEITDISLDRVHHILHIKLLMKKLCSDGCRDYLQSTKNACGQTFLFGFFKGNRATMTSPKRLGGRTVLPGDVDDPATSAAASETRSGYNYTPESKQQSKQWLGPGERAPKEAWIVVSARKVMATIFWDSKGIILIIT
ncbi:hypothetical protein LAZ67_6003891 [Cordylochernes scorpioides]|uniref:Uncharacterized protein n=1 Tax=Cordylochernes scorpioides TaxID=51811 RepID=A0ABY6KL02_9ARAC|nr:hypothetical protein LAZ67_6003891 [Cordylochernes scorpioides]